MIQLSLDLNPITYQTDIVYKGWKIVVLEKKGKQVERYQVISFFSTPKNKTPSTVTYYESYIYKNKHPKNGKRIMGYSSGCYNLASTIACTKTWIDNFWDWLNSFE